MRAISDEELAVYRKTMQARGAQQQAQLKQRFALAEQVVKAAAALLHQDFHAERVILFGSLLHQDLFHITSDIDLAVSGLAPLDYFTAVARLQDLSAFDIDLVRLESCKPTLKATILKEGREL